MESHELEKRLREAKRAYYAGKPIMTDAKFDRLEEKLRKMDPDNPVLQEVGWDQGEVPKVTDRHKMNSSERLAEAITLVFSNYFARADVQKELTEMIDSYIRGRDKEGK